MSGPLPALTWPGADLQGGSVARLRRVFEQGFSAADVAEPLLSVDAAAPEAADLLAASQQLSVVGLRSAGRIVAVKIYPTGDSAPSQSGPIPVTSLPFVRQDVSLQEVARRLDATELLLVEAFGEVAGTIGREYLGKPATRMWLFGLVSLIEMALRDTIARQYRDDTWQHLLSPTRLQHAARLQEFRRTGGERVDLLECLQLSDLSTLILKDPALRALTPHTSRRQGEMHFRKFENLRDLLAHSQNLGPEHQPVVGKLAGQLEEILRFAAVGTHSPPQP